MPATLTPAVVATPVRWRPSSCSSAPWRTRRRCIPRFRSFAFRLIDGDQRPPGHLVRVTLPDLSVLASVRADPQRSSSPTDPHDASACGCCSAGSAAPRSIWRQAAPRRFALVLSEGTARAITSEDGRPLRGRCRWRQRRLARHLPFGRLERLSEPSVAHCALVPTQVHAIRRMPSVAWTLAGGARHAGAGRLGPGQHSHWLRQAPSDRVGRRHRRVG